MPHCTPANALLVHGLVGVHWFRYPTAKHLQPFLTRQALALAVTWLDCQAERIVRTLGDWQSVGVAGDSQGRSCYKFSAHFRYSRLELGLVQVIPYANATQDNGRDHKAKVRSHSAPCSRKSAKAWYLTASKFSHAILTILQAL